MESLWEQNDRQKQREEMDLAAFLQMLEEKQRGLRAAVRALDAMRESPKSREEQRAAEMAERKLGEEIGPLKEKIETTLSKAAQPARCRAARRQRIRAPAVPEEVKQAIADLQSGPTMPAERSRPRPGNFTPVNLGDRPAADRSYRETEPDVLQRRIVSQRGRPRRRRTSKPLWIKSPRSRRKRGKGRGPSPPVPPPLPETKDRPTRRPILPNPPGIRTS